MDNESCLACLVALYERAVIVTVLIRNAPTSVVSLFAKRTRCGSMVDIEEYTCFAFNVTSEMGQDLVVLPQNRLQGGLTRYSNHQVWVD